MISCECSVREYYKSVSLFRNDQLVETIKFVDYKNVLGSTRRKELKVAKFQNLERGNYSIHYHNFYGQDSIEKVIIGTNQTTRIQICHDNINPETFKQQTAIDRLENGDTLFINYHQKIGEFDGSDFGFWIWKSYDKIRGAYFELYNTSELGWDSRVTTYKQYKSEAQFNSDSFILDERQTEQVKRFLVEAELYPVTAWRNTNAPDFLTIYSRTDTLERTVQEAECILLSKLNITPANKR